MTWMANSLHASITNTKRALLGVSALLSVVTWLWIYDSINQEATAEGSKDLAFVNDKTGDDNPVLLWWDPIPGMTNGMVRCGNLICLRSVERSKLNHNVLMMILFYGSQFAENGLPLPRKLGHIWGIFHEESPKNNMYLFQNEIIADIFNYSSTYKRQSHLPVPTIWLTDPAIMTDMQYFVPLDEKNRLRKRGLAPIVFIHSDCSTPSDRSNYIRMLMKHIDVDSYGACENNKELPNDIRVTTSMSRMDSPDFFKLLAKYKFAIAFENAVCDDYITEKFWRTFHLGIVPIVFGSPKIKDFLPANKSAVIINDFLSVEFLANHIKFLDNNDAEYEKYTDYKRNGISNPSLLKELEKRDWGQGKSYRDVLHSFQCHMCENIHKMQKLTKQKKPLPVSRAKYDHFSCPPVKTFNSNGHYILDESMFSGDWEFSKWYALSIKHFINKGMNVTQKQFHDYARHLERDYSEKLEKSFLSN